MNKLSEKRDPLAGEHQANNQGSVDWAVYHADNESLTLNRGKRNEDDSKKEIV